MYDVENLRKLFHSYGDNEAFRASQYVNRIHESIFMQRASIILFYSIANSTILLLYRSFTQRRESDIYANDNVLVF